MNHTMMRQAALVLTVVGGLSCARQVTPEAKTDAAAAPSKTVAVEEPATLPDDHHLAKLELPLFSPDAEQRYMELRRKRQAEGRPQSELTNTIDFASTLDEAFERATREDKPVLLITQVRENGDLNCDV